MKMVKLEKLFMDTVSHKKHVIKRACRLIDLVPVSKDQHFLEVGCGTGAVSLHCAKMYPFSVTGVDVDPEQIEMAKSYATGADVEFLEGDATHLPFEDETFDIVLSFGVMHHIPNWPDALQEMIRVLKSHRYFIYWDIMYPRLLAKIGKSFTHSYGVTTLDMFNQFVKQNNLSEIHTSVKKSFAFNQLEAVLQKP